MIFSTIKLNKTSIFSVKSTPSRILIFSVALLGFAIAPLTPNSAFALQNGTNGVDGDPATDGQDAVDQATRSIEVDSRITTPIVGNNGGVGGHGGNGIDGDDPDNNAAAGNGGDGGDGAALNVFNMFESVSNFPFHLDLLSGKGGRAGSGGKSIGVPNGEGGNAGHGGHIDLTLTTGKSFSLNATAGDGGDANGFQKIAGNGGTITTEVSTISSPYQSIEAPIYLSQNLQAGHGGTGRYLAAAGDGGSILSKGQYEFMPNSGRALFNVNAIAGNGGRSYGGIAGKGGGIDWTISGLSLPASVTQASRLRLFAKAGAGGDSSQYYGIAGPAGDGGSVFVHGVPEQLLSVSGGKIDLVMQLAAGNGGNSNSHADGGEGGSVTVSDLILSTSGSDSTNQSISSTVNISGGHGGNSLNGTGGDGGSISLIDSLHLQTDGSADYKMTSIGGNGGNGLVGGNGGHSYITYGTTSPSQPNRDLSVSLTSIGGNGGVDGKSGVGAFNIYAIGFHNVSAVGHALQGVGSNTTAEHETISEVIANNTRGGVDSVTRSYGYSAPRFEESLAAPKIGRSVILGVSASSVGGKLTQSHGLAIGTFGTDKSGYAKVFSSAGTAGKQLAHAIAESIAPAASQTATDTSRFAFSEAWASAFDGSGKSEAKTTVYGHYSFGRSAAHTHALQGEAIAVARSQSVARPHQAILTTTARSLSKANEYQRIGANSDIYFRRTELPAHEYIPEASNNRTDLYLSSGIGSLVGIQDTGLNSNFDFDAATNDVFAAVHYLSGVREDHETLQETSLVIDLRQEINPWEADHELSVFFYDVGLSFPSTDGDFPLDMLLEVGGQTVIDQSFTTGFDAISFLDETVFNLGSLTAGEDLVTHFEMSFQHDYDQAFEFKMGIAGLADMPSMGPASLQAVPEPSSIGVFTALTASLVLVRRRRRG